MHFKKNKLYYLINYNFQIYVINPNSKTSVN
jgi:hypothetical protein